MINYLTMGFSFVSMTAMLIMLFRTDMGANFSGKNKIEKTEKSYITAHIENEIPEAAADNMTTVFRDNNPSTQTKIILHDSQGLMNYLKNNFIVYTSKITPPQGYEWKLGMTPMYFTDGGINKLTMSFLPTLMESARPKHVIDYWISKKANDDFYQKYFKPLLDTVTAAGFKSFIFDEGQLWP